MSLGFGPAQRHAIYEYARVRKRHYNIGENSYETDWHKLAILTIKKSMPSYWQLYTRGVKRRLRRIKQQKVNQGQGQSNVFRR